MPGSVRARYAEEIGRFARILATAHSPTNMAAALAPVRPPAPAVPAAPTERQRHLRWTEMLIDDGDAALRAFWEADYSDWSATTSGTLSLTDKQRHVARYASVLDDLTMRGRSVLDWLLEEAEACFTDLRLAADGLAVPARPTYAVHTWNGARESLEALKRTWDHDQKTELAVNIRRFVEAFDRDDRRAVSKRVSMAAVHRYTVVNTDTRAMLRAAIDAIVTLLNEPRVLNRYHDDPAPKRIATSQTLIELLAHTDAGKAYIARVAAGGTERLTRRSPIHTDIWVSYLDGFRWDPAQKDVALVEGAAIWTGMGSGEAVAASLENALGGGTKSIAKTYLTVLKTIRLARCVAVLRRKNVALFDFAEVRAHYNSLPKMNEFPGGFGTAAGISNVTARGIVAVHSLWAWVDATVKIAEKQDRSTLDLLAYAATIFKALADNYRFAEEVYGFSLEQLHVSAGIPVTLSPTQAARRKAGAETAKATAKKWSQRFNYASFIVAVAESAVEFHKAYRSDRFAEQFMHGLLGFSAAAQALHVLFSSILRTPHPAAFVIGLVGLLLTAAAQGVQAWLAKDDISIVLGATYFGRGNTAARWRVWHLPAEPGDPDSPETASFENVASTFVRGATAEEAFEDWRRQIGGVLGLMGTYDLEIKNGTTTMLSFTSSRLITGFAETQNTPTDPLKKKTVLPQGSTLRLYDATRGHPLFGRFALADQDPHLPVSLMPEGTPPNAGAAETAELLHTALRRALRNEAGANIPDHHTFAGLPGLGGGARHLEIVLEMPLPAWPGASNGAGGIVAAQVIRRKDAP